MPKSAPRRDWRERIGPWVWALALVVVTAALAGVWAVHSLEVDR